jgi:hypothetical protein
MEKSRRDTLARVHTAIHLSPTWCEGTLRMTVCDDGDGGRAALHCRYHAPFLPSRGGALLKMRANGSWAVLASCGASAKQQVRTPLELGIARERQIGTPCLTLRACLASVSKMPLSITSPSLSPASERQLASNIIICTLDPPCAPVYADPLPIASIKWALYGALIGASGIS